MDDGDGKQPLSYLAVDDDAEEVDRRREGRTIIVVMSVGAALILSVWAIPEMMWMLPRPAAFAPAAPAPAAPVVRAAPPPQASTGSTKLLAAIEAYEDARGVYPASLEQLRPTFLDASLAELASWRYVTSADRREYQLHHLPDAAAAATPAASRD